MTRTEAPVGKSVGLFGVLLFLIVVTGVVTIGAALADGKYGLAIAGGVFLVVAIVLAVRVRRAR